MAVKVFRLDITPEQAEALASELAVAVDAELVHPSIVQPISARVEGTVAYRAEVYVAAESLDIAMRHYAPAPLSKALPFITQLAAAVDFARAAGVGHGALHLRDIFLTPDQARASGFGVVEALERVGLRAPVRRPYSAPERIAGDGWSTPADVFSLAAIAFELLTGRRPSGTGDQMGALTGGQLGLNPGAIRDVLAKAMADEPGHRYATALAFASALDVAARGEPVEPARGEPVEPRASPFAPPVAPATVSASSVALRTPDTGPEPGADLDSDADLDLELDPDLHPDLDLGPATLALDDGPDGAVVIEVIAADPEDDPTLEGGPDAARDEPSIRESPAVRAVTLFDDDEGTADFAREIPERARFADDFIDAEPTPVVDEARVGPLPIESPAASGRQESAHILTGAGLSRPPVLADESARHDALFTPPSDEDPPAPEGSRTPMLPLAVTLIAGLMIGSAAGVFWERGRTSSPTDAVAAPVAAPPAAGSVAQPQGGKAWSEQTVARPPATPSAALRPSAGPTRGRLQITSVPSNASVTINSQWRGRTPLTVNALSFGSYSIRVVQPGFAVAREDFALSAASPSRTLSFRLKPTGAETPAPTEASRFGAIYVDSRPRGARVFVDGKEMGTTPARFPEIALGSHVVRLELEGHRPWSNVARVTAGTEARVTGSLERIQ